MTSKHTLRGAAKQAHGAKKTRLKKEEEKSTPDGALTNEPPIQRALASLETVGTRIKNPSLERVKQRLQCYQGNTAEDRTGCLLPELLVVLYSEGRRNFCSDVLARDDGQFRELMEELREFLFHPLKATSGKTPKISTVDSDNDPDPDPARADLSKLREDCLLRDNNRCIISGHYDVYQIPRKEREGLLTTYTSCSHIFPYLSGPRTLDGILTDGGELIRVFRFWAFVYRYFPNVKGVLDMNKPGEINVLRNTMTLDGSLHTAFASFQLTLELGTFDGFPTLYNRWLPKTDKSTSKLQRTSNSRIQNS